MMVLPRRLVELLNRFFFEPGVAMPRGSEWIIILVIVVLVFGVGRLSKLGEDLGEGIRAFRKSLSGEEQTEDKDNEKKS